MPQTVFDVGDPITSRLILGVIPDGSTVATVTVQRPDGVLITGLTPSGWNSDVKIVQWYATDDGTPGGTTLAAAGDWLAVWKVTGTGASVTPKVYNVVPLPGTSTRPSWSPFLSDVADHVPFLTVDTTAPGSQLWLGTFTGNTSPTDEQAQRHIDAAAAVVGAGLGVSLTVPIQRLARAVTALLAAATLCRAFARDQQGRDVATALEARATASKKALDDAAENAGSNTLATLPVMYAPPPVPWGDRLLVDSGPLATSRQYLWPE